MINILFVCMGNICRSPSAEAVMKKLIEKDGLSDKIFIDSAGTIGYHAGESADRRMKQFAEKRGYSLDSLSRKFKFEDFSKFDYIVLMDKYNKMDVEALDSSRIYSSKMSLMTYYASDKSLNEGPDPYYGG